MAYGDSTSLLNIVYYSTTTILQNLTMTGRGSLLHRIGPLPVHPPTSVGSLFATGVGADQFTTYTSGFYPLV